jgi:hypothetical protein
VVGVQREDGIGTGVRGIMGWRVVGRNMIGGSRRSIFGSWIVWGGSVNTRANVGRMGIREIGLVGVGRGSVLIIIVVCRWNVFFGIGRVVRVNVVGTSEILLSVSVVVGTGVIIWIVGGVG